MNSTNLHIVVRSYSFPLSILYALVSLVTLTQISRIIFYRHNVFHYQFGFLTFSFFWGILRVVYTVLTPWPQEYQIGLQGFGLFVQFMTFTFLVLYYVQIIYRANHTWKTVRRIALAIYGLVNLIFLFSLLVSVFAVKAFSQAEMVNTIWSIHSFIISVMYLTLAILLAFYGWKLGFLVTQTKLKVPFLKSKVAIICLTIILVLVFMTRAIYNFLSGLNIVIISPDNPEEMPISTQSIVFTLYFMWDVIPAAMMIHFFWRIPDTSKRYLTKSGPPEFHGIYPVVNYMTGLREKGMDMGHFANLEEYSPSFRVANQSELDPSSSINLFNNPSRYDSDYESPSSKPISVTPTRHAQTIGSYSSRNLLLQPKGSPFDD